MEPVRRLQLLQRACTWCKTGTVSEQKITPEPSAEDTKLARVGLAGPFPLPRRLIYVADSCQTFPAEWALQTME
jgi:hypothetical protein